MNSADRATAAATAAALLAVAGQVAGKAARDALFLSSFSITDLPTVVIASSIVSVIVVVATARLFSTFGPATVVPTAFVLSAVLLLVEWSLLERMPRVIAIAAYLHFAVFGLVLISGIWSVVNERFDPRTAKARVGRIALGATVGGVLGGLLAERVAAMYSLAALLPILSLISVAGAGLVVLIGRDPSLRKQKPPAEPSRNGFAVLGKNRYLREIAALLLVVTVAAGFLDYVFKAEASAALEDREVLMRFFAGFYTALGVATFLIQSTLANSVLRRFGIARTVSVLPAAVALGAVGLVAAPGLIAATLARGGESALRSSLFRTGYELLYTPVSEADRRATKTIIDAGFDRLGDAVAGGLITVLLLVLPTGGTAVLVVGAGICGVVAMLLAMDLHRGYVASLEARLLEQADDVEIDPTDDVLRTSAVMQTYATLDLRQFVQSRRVQAPAARTAEARSVPAAPKDPVVARLGELRSSDSEQVIKAILDPRRLERPHAAAMVELLARDDMSAHVVQVLRASMPRFAGLLLDALLDPDSEFAIRRRVPRILGAVAESWVADGLLKGLTDRRFEVRYQCGRALARIHHQAPDVRFDDETVCDLVLREVAVDRRVWESYRLLDTHALTEEEGTDAYQWLDEYLADRTGRGLEHVFTLLALVYPTEPLRIAFRGLHTDDSRLRGTALEYLESILPERVREKLWPFIDNQSQDRKVSPGSRDAVLQELLRSNAAIEASIAGLPRKS